MTKSLESESAPTLETHVFPTDKELSSRVYSEFLQHKQYKEFLPEENREDTFLVTVYDDPSLLTDEEKQSALDGRLASESYWAGQGGWWNVATEVVQDRLIDPGLSEWEFIATAKAALSVRAVHDYSVQTDHGEDGHFTVVECGKSADSVLTEDEQETIATVLSLIDQFSGGAIANNSESQRIITTAADLAQHNTVDGDIGGVAGSFGILLNLRTIRSVAAKYHISTSDFLSVVLAHELLGHHVDRLANDGETGKLEEYINYSPEKITNERNREVHKQITVKDAKYSNSRPVRGYGWSDSGEDLATVIESLVARALGIQDNINRSERMATNPDEYRDELIMNILISVAQAIYEKGKGHGFVGSPLAYEDTPEGVKVKPGRWLERSSRDPRGFIDSEIADCAKSFVQEFNNKYAGYVINTDNN